MKNSLEERIGYDPEFTAVVIDMQEEFLKDYFDSRKRSDLISSQERIIHLCENNNHEVIFVKYAGHGPIVQEFSTYDFRVFGKKTDSAFQSEEFSKYLSKSKNEGNYLILMGARLRGCVEDTLVHAREKYISLVPTRTTVPYRENLSSLKGAMKKTLRDHALPVDSVVNLIDK